MKTVPCRRSPHQGGDCQWFVSQSDDSIGTQKQLKDEMSVDLVNAQMA